MPRCLANQREIQANLTATHRVTTHYTDAKVNYRLVCPSFWGIAVSCTTARQYWLPGLVQSFG
jgi:hypothetical protein